MTIVLQNSATKDYLLLLEYNLNCQQFSEMRCFTVSDFFQYYFDGQINDLRKETDKNLSSNKPLYHG